MVERVVVVTSTETSDDPVAAWCEQAGCAYLRGSLDDVAQRLLTAAAALGLMSFVRINADSPLMDPQIVTRVIKRFEFEPLDLATNVFPRSFPKGQSVEVIRTEALEKLAGATRDPEDLEHVTRYFYRHPMAFSIGNVMNETDLSGVQLSVDSDEDLLAFEMLLKRLKRPHWEYGLPELLTAMNPGRSKNQARIAAG